MTNRRVQIFWKPLKAFWCGGVQPAVIAAAEWNCVNLTGRDILPWTVPLDVLDAHTRSAATAPFRRFVFYEDFDYGQSL